MKKISGKKLTTVTRTYEFSTDDIEELIKTAYKFSGNTQFTWNIGQWVSLEVVIKDEVLGVDD